MIERIFDMSPGTRFIVDGDTSCTVCVRVADPLWDLNGYIAISGNNAGQFFFKFEKNGVGVSRDVMGRVVVKNP